MLVVVAHPDDETLTSGGLLAHLAQHAEVTLVTGTRGERGEVIGAAVAALAHDPVALAEHRSAELGRAVAALGIDRALFLDTVDGGPRFVDSGMRWASGSHTRALPAADAGPDAFSVVPLDRPVRLLGQVIEQLQPDLVLVDEPGGGYGHPDHRRAHEVTMAAVDRASPRPPLVAWFVRPSSVVAEATRWVHDHPELPSTGVDGAPLEPAPPQGDQASIVVPDEEVDVVLNTTAQTPALLAAMRAHATQVQEVREVPGSAVAAGWFALSNGVLQPVLTQAGLRAAPGSVDGPTLRRALARMGRPGSSSAEAGPVYVGAMTAFCVVLGLMLGAAGTLFHRATPPWGFAVGVVALVAAGLLARTFVDRLGHLAYVLGVVAVVLAMTYVSPGGDVLVSDEPLGTAWLLASVAAAALPALASRRMLRDS